VHTDAFAGRPPLTATDTQPCVTCELGVPHPHTIRLVIELYANGEPISGRILEPPRLAASFRGWLALAQAIEASRPHQPQSEVSDAT
jgi:hypothetical protein